MLNITFHSEKSDIEWQISHPILLKKSSLFIRAVPHGSSSKVRHPLNAEHSIIIWSLTNKNSLEGAQTCSHQKRCRVSIIGPAWKLSLADAQWALTLRLPINGDGDISISSIVEKICYCVRAGGVHIRDLMQDDAERRRWKSGSWITCSSRKDLNMGCQIN